MVPGGRAEDRNLEDMCSMHARIRPRVRSGDYRGRQTVKAELDYRSSMPSSCQRRRSAHKKGETILMLDIWARHGRNA